MKGFILSLHKVSNEDMIVTILTEDKVITLYRFYGARHSVLQLGYLIDFEIEEDRYGTFLPRLRSVTHIGTNWLYKRDRLMVWHNFIKLLNIHLRDTQELEIFYFNTIMNAYKRFEKQNPKRVISEIYIDILKFEGRLHNLNKCYICEQSLGQEISLMQSLIPAHPTCIYAPSIAYSKISDYFDTSKTVWLEDNEVDVIYSIIQKGL